jgi:hypothetical protein
LPDLPSGNPRKTPGFGYDPENLNIGLFRGNTAVSFPDFDPKIWVSFRFGHTLGLPEGDLPRKGLWRPANEGVGNGRFFGLGFAGKQEF